MEEREFKKGFFIGKSIKRNTVWFGSKWIMKKATEEVPIIQWLTERGEEIERDPLRRAFLVRDGDRVALWATKPQDQEMEDVEREVEFTFDLKFSDVFPVDEFCRIIGHW
jgi:hypothetical protein